MQARESIRKARSEMGAVFWVTVSCALAFVLWGVFFSENLKGVAQSTFQFVVRDMSWFYLIPANLFLIFVVYLAFSKYGKIKLGKEGEEPEFSRFSWFAMMFQAGMGLAIIFWGVSEPVTHYANPPFGGAEPSTPEAAQLAMAYTYFHWALHPWAIYAIVGLAVAYFNFRRDQPGLISSAFRPLFGDRVDGPLGKAIDVLAILATLFGVAVSLGQGGLQIDAGLGQTLGTPTGFVPQLVIIGVTTVAFMLSASTPVEKGVKWLSNITLLVAPLFLLFFFVAGPTVLQVNALTQGVGDYLGQIVPMSLRMNSFAEDTEFLGKFTIFYWSWWVAWAPYVGIFIARISRGRTIREFVIGAVLVPSLFNVVWFTVFGASAISLDRSTGGAISAAAQADPAQGLFAYLQEYPFPLFMSLVAIFLLWIYFIAGADAGTIVLGRMSARGILNPSPATKLTWGLVMAAFAAVLLYIGGFEALLQASVLAGVPFTVIMVLLCWSLYKSMREDARMEEERPVEPQRESEDGAAGEPVASRPVPSPSK